MENNYGLIKAFGPWQFLFFSKYLKYIHLKIPEEDQYHSMLLNKLNKFIDDTINDEEQSKKLDVGKGLVGDVKQEFKLDKKTVQESGWLKFLGDTVAQWIYKDTGNKISEFRLIESWVVRQFENEYNPIHWHSGHISGAGFLKLPETFGKPYQDNKPDYRGGNLELIHGNRMFLSQCRYPIKPKVGDFYFFPHYLMHTVYPFKGTKEERRSISFNGLIDNKIFNIFG